MKKEKQDRICSTKRLKINNRRTVITAIGFYSSEGFSKIIGQKRRKIDTVFCDVNLVDIPLEEIFQGDDARSVQFFARLKKDVESRDKNVLLIIDNPRITTNSIKRIYQLTWQSFFRLRTLIAKCGLDRIKIGY